MLFFPFKHAVEGGLGVIGQRAYSSQKDNRNRQYGYKLNSAFALFAGRLSVKRAV